MPGGSVGIGFTFFGGRGRLRGGKANPKQLHFDGLECFNIFFPYFPVRAVHVWNWRVDRSEWSFTRRNTEYSYRVIPIRWSTELVARVFLRCWIWIPILTSGGLFFSFAHGLIARVAGGLFFAATGFLYWHLWRIEKRDRRIRELLGKHKLGFSDPAHWTRELQQFVVVPKSWFGTTTYLSAGEELLSANRYADAMWAARLAIAFENRSLGENLTDRILALAPPDLKTPANPNYPKLELRDDEPSRFWKGIMKGKSLVKFTETMFANNLFGSLAAATDSSHDPVVDQQLDQYNRLFRTEPHTGSFRWMGVGIVAVTYLACFFLFLFSNFFRIDPAAKANQERIAEDRKRELEQKKKRKGDQDNPDKNSPDKREVAVDENGIPLSIDPIGPPGTWVHLVDLPYYHLRPGPWRITKNGSTGERFGQVPIRVNGKESPHGIGMHPPKRGTAAVTFAIYKQAKTFEATAAMNDTAVTIREHALFEVWGDGQKLWGSEEMKRAGQTDDCQISIDEVDLLELRVISPIDYWSLHAVWLEPRIQLK